MLNHQELTLFNQLLYKSSGRGLTLCNKDEDSTHYITVADLNKHIKDSDNLDMLLMLMKVYNPQTHYIQMVINADSIEFLDTIPF
jgi:hypothetical protein